MPRLTAATLAAALLLPAVAAGQTPKVGDVQRVPVISLALAAGSTGTESKRVTYTPPPGWYVRSHRVEVAEKYGLSSFTVNTVPANWKESSDDRSERVERQQVHVAAKFSEATAAGGKVAAKQAAESRETRQAAVSHHAVVVEAVARGEGFFKGGGGINLTVTAELVYVGTGRRP